MSRNQPKFCSKISNWKLEKERGFDISCFSLRCLSVDQHRIENQFDPKISIDKLQSRAFGRNRANDPSRYRKEFMVIEPVMTCITRRSHGFQH